MIALRKLLLSFEYATAGELLNSLLPSTKYLITLLVVSLSAIVSSIDYLFGMNAIALFAFVMILMVELTSGLYASYVQSIPFSSSRFSRFLFKLAQYLFLLFGTHALMQSYADHDKQIMSGLFDWLNNYLVVHIMFENVISILENGAVIQGKPKGTWINGIKIYLSNFFQPK